MPARGTHFGISRPTFYRWQERYRSRGLRGLENRSHRPHAVRCPSWSVHEIQVVLLLREQYPRWEEAKLQVLLAAPHIDLSCSMIGRMLHSLTLSGQLREGTRPGGRTIARPRPYATRKPTDYPVVHPGDLVQIDTKDVRFGNGRTVTRLSLVDTISRYAAAEISGRAAAATVAAHLELTASMPTSASTTPSGPIAPWATAPPPNSLPHGRSLHDTCNASTEPIH